MTAMLHDEESRGSRGRPAAAAVLADRLAAALVHHEPGWRLPRLTALARRYSVSSAEIDAAIEELAGRHLVRRLPDGQVYRASPAEYWVPLEGVFGLVSRVDPMGGHLACTSRHATVRRPPEDIGRSLGLGPGEPVLAVRCVWTVGGEPGALAASYLPEAVAAGLGVVPIMQPGEEEGAAPGAQELSETISPLAFPYPWRPAGAEGPRPGAVQIEMGLPPPSAARTLRLSAGEPVATVTVSFAAPATAAPVALTMAMLRPELFRIVVEAAPQQAPGKGTAALASAWTHTGDGWDS
ncbi:MAG: UTRA domain-containing protein [Actinobacteria bacterium]|nr:UTRA domain-containing protein [Actinomycetota bacterium]